MGAPSAEQVRGWSANAARHHPELARAIGSLVEPPEA
jgi:hypothetical protein